METAAAVLASLSVVFLLSALAAQDVRDSRRRRDAWRLVRRSAGAKSSSLTAQNGELL